MVDIQHLRAEAIRLGAIDRAAAQLLNAAGDQIQRMQVQLNALLELMPKPVEVPRG